MAYPLPRRRGGRTPYAELTVMNPGRGLNSLISENLIDNRESSSLENIQFVESGAPAKAPGYTRAGNILNNNPRGLGFYNDTANSDRYLLTTDGSALVYLNGSVWTTIGGATFDTDAVITFTQARGKMYIWDAVNGGAELSGLTLSRPGTMPKAQFSIYYQGYQCAAGVPTQENRLYISVSTDASDFTNASTTLNNSTEVPGATVFAGSGANFVDIAKDDGDRITGLGKFQDALIIFKERSIYQLVFDTNGDPVVSPVTKSYGCVSHRTIDNADNDLIFLSRNGYYLFGNEPNYFNVVRTNELSARIHSTIETISASNFAKAAAVFNEYVYYCAVPSGGATGNNTVITYDRRFQAWSLWTHVAAESFAVFVDENNEEHLYFTSADSGKVYELLTGTYSADGSAISAQWTSKAFDLDDFDTYKRWIDVTILFRQLVGTVTIEVITDGGAVEITQPISTATISGMGIDMLGEEWLGGTPSSASNIATATNNVPYRIRLSLKARSVKIRVSNTKNNETFVVLGVKFTYRKYSHFTFPSNLKVSGGGTVVTTTPTVDADDEPLFI